MFKDFAISETDWNSTPQSVKTALSALQHQARLMEMRFCAYEQKLAALEAKEAEIESVKTEVAALRERLGQNSSNSSRPPSSDPPPATRPSRRESSGKKQGGQAGHQGAGRSLKSVAAVDHLVDLRPVREGSGADEQRGGAGTAAGCFVAEEIFWDTERRWEPLC